MVEKDGGHILIFIAQGFFNKQMIMDLALSMYSWIAQSDVVY